MEIRVNSRNIVTITSGSAVFVALGDAEKIERFQQIQTQERQMREEGFLDTQVHTLCENMYFLLEFLI